MSTIATAPPHPYRAAMWIGLFITLMTLSPVLIVWAWRGRRVDDHPVCRRCRYDLMGVSGACPECGADITRAAAVRSGNRVRRSRWLVCGSVLMLLSVAGLTLPTYVQVSDFNFYTLKPFGWTLSSAVQAAGQPQEPNIAELQRRLDANSLSTSQINQLVDAALDVQGDRSVPWRVGDGWHDVLDDLLAQQALTQAQVQRYFEQGLTLEFDVRSVLWRGRTNRIDFHIWYDRLTVRTRFRGTRRAETVTLGGVDFIGHKAFHDTTRSHLEQGPGEIYITSLQLPRFSSLADGLTTVDATFVFELELVEPAGYAPMELRLPVSVPARLVKHDATVGTFETDEALRTAMASAWAETRVETPNGDVIVWLRLDQPPVAMAMGVWLRQGEAAWRVGSFQVKAGDDRRWRRIRSTRAQQPQSGEVTVELHPEQDAVDHQMQLGTYWGDAMVRDGVIVNEPYTPAFNLDESLAAAMEQAVTLSRVTVSRTSRGRHISASFSAYGAPARVAYRIKLRSGGEWIDAADHHHLNVDANQNSSYRTGSLPLPDPDATTVDVLYVPDHNWEQHSRNATPPWGYPILFENVPLPDADQGEPATGRIHGRALLDESAGE